MPNPRSAHVRVLPRRGGSQPITTIRRGALRRDGVDCDGRVEQCVAGPEWPDTYPTARRLDVATGHGRRRFLVLYQHEPHPVLMTALPLHDSVDAVARKCRTPCRRPTRSSAPPGLPM